MRTSLVVAASVLVMGCGAVMPVPDAGPACPALSPDGGTRHGGSVTTDETWTAAGSPHVLPFDLSVSAKITLDPCAIVTLAVDKTITVGANGSIEAKGTATQPVVLKNAEGQGNWASIRLIGGSARLSYTVLENGGAALNIGSEFQAALDVRSAKTTLTAPDPVLFADHLTINGSATQGVYVHSGGGFSSDSQALTIAGSAGHAATFSPNLVGTLPSGTYTGNTQNDVLLTDELPGAIRWDVTLHDRGIPYYSGGTTQFGVTSVSAVLTIEPGVVWKFKKGTGELSVDPSSTPSTGVLIARGTAEKPIVFTSAEATPAAGDWLGIWMGGDDPRNSLDFVRIEYAGRLQAGSGSSSCQSLTMGNVSNGAALRVYHLPPATLVTNTTFIQSATNAIDRGWRNDARPSLLSSNTFTAINLCNETFPRDMNGACPTPPAPCPK